MKHSLNRYVFLFALASIVGPVALAKDLPKWLVPTSQFRIFSSPCHSMVPSVLVPIPEERQETMKDAVVFSRKGDRIPSRPVVIDGRLLAVEVHLPRGKNPSKLTKESSSAWRPAGTECQLSLQIYLLEEPDELADSTARAPIAARFNDEIIVGRPASSAEAIRHSENSKQLPLLANLSATSLGQLKAYMAVASPLKKGDGMKGDQRQRWRYQLASTLRISQSGAWQFAVSTGKTGAWFMLVDNTPTFSWCESTPTGDKFRVSPPVRLEAGISTLTFMGSLSRGEVFPQLYVRPPGSDDFRLLNDEDLLVPYPPDGFAIQNKDQDFAIGASIRLDSFQRFYPSSDPVAIVEASGLPTASPPRLIRKDNSPISLDAQTWLPHQPRWRIATGVGDNVSHWSIPVSWGDRNFHDLRFTIQPLPIFIPVDNVLPVRFALTLPAVVPSEKVEIRCDHYSGESIVRSDLVPLAESPFKRTLPIPADDPTVDVVVLTPEIAGFPIAPSHRIRLMDGATSEPAFARAGARLRTDDAFVALRRLIPTEAIATIPKRPLTRITILDEWAALGVRFQDQFNPAESLGKEMPKITWRHLPITGNGGSRPFLARFHQLSVAMTTKPDAILFLTGVHERIAGLDHRDETALLAWFARYCIQRDVVPIFSTAPWAQTDTTAAQHRSYALLIRETAAIAAAPSIDLHSESLLNGDYKPHLALGETTTASTPSAEIGRRITRTIADTIRRYNDKQ